MKVRLCGLSVLLMVSMGSYSALAEGSKSAAAAPIVSGQEFGKELEASVLPKVEKIQEAIQAQVEEIEAEKRIGRWSNSYKKSLAQIQDNAECPDFARRKSDPADLEQFCEAKQVGHTGMVQLPARCSFKIEGRRSPITFIDVLTCQVSDCKRGVTTCKSAFVLPGMYREIRQARRGGGGSSVPPQEQGDVKAGSAQ
jgi:hypothetical protein